VLIAYHLFFVAIPEEFFYRGYVQTRLNELLPRRFLIAGVPFGHGLWIAALFFAFGHSLVEFQWWHFATFFPGLLFGLLRERSGGVITGAFLHAACNVIVHMQDALYGVISPG
jgi:membrane protease YdiL (CAAX protease family)